LIKKVRPTPARVVTTSSRPGHGHGLARILYVDDAARGIVLAAERYDGREPINLGVGSEITIRDLTELIAV